MTSSTQDMHGRVALVTGGGSGLGRAISRRLAAAGAHVLVADVDAAGAEATVAGVSGGTAPSSSTGVAGGTAPSSSTGVAGGTAEAVELDVTDAACVDAVLGAAFERFGPSFDCLVNNAGTDRGADIPDVSDEQWHGVFAVNTHGPMYASRAFVRGVLAQPPRATPADLLSVVSISALTVGSGAGAYNSSKAALLKLTEVLQTEARERGWPVRVCALSPAAMNTPMMDQWHLPAEKMMDPASVAELVHLAMTLPPEVVLQSAVLTARTEQYPR